jgi:hypothetical protein
MFYYILIIFFLLIYYFKLSREIIYYFVALIYTCEYVYIYVCVCVQSLIALHMLPYESGFGYPRVWFWARIFTRIGVRVGFGF